MTIYSGWLGKGSYTDAEVSGRNVETPFELESDVCLLKCVPGYWENYGTGLISATDPARDQRCTSDNCKTFDAG